MDYKELVRVADSGYVSDEDQTIDRICKEFGVDWYGGSYQHFSSMGKDIRYLIDCTGKGDAVQQKIQQAVTEEFGSRVTFKKKSSSEFYIVINKI